MATHSPFIPQAADENGVFILRPDAMTPDRVSAYQDPPSVKGWRADQILHVLFSVSDLRDPETEDKIRRHAELQARASTGQLDLKEGPELDDLNRWLDQHLSPPGDNAEEMSRYAAIQNQVNQE